MNCNYQTSYTPYLFWYVQYENKRLELLLKSSTDKKRAPHHFQADLIKGDSTFHLKKLSVQVSDSATYYCVLSDTVTGATGVAEHKPRGHRWALTDGRQPQEKAVF